MLCLTAAAMQVASAIVLSSGASFHLVYDFHFSICMFEVWCTGRSERARCYYHVVICSGTSHARYTPHIMHGGFDRQIAATYVSLLCLIAFSLHRIPSLASISLWTISYEYSY